MQPYLHSDGSGRDGLFMWNLTNSVGKQAANSDNADVSFIQFYYTAAAAHPLTVPERKLIYQKVKLTGQCTGRDDDPLVQAIFAHQRGLNHSQIDGRISVARGSGKIGALAFFVLRLGARFATMFPDQWPRLDKIPGCPPSVAAASKAAVPLIEAPP